MRQHYEDRTNYFNYEGRNRISRTNQRPDYLRTRTIKEQDDYKITSLELQVLIEKFIRNGNKITRL